MITTEKIQKLSKSLTRKKLTGNQRLFIFFLFSRLNWQNGLSTGIISDSEITEESGLRQDVIKKIRDSLVKEGIIIIKGSVTAWEYKLIHSDTDIKDTDIKEEQENQSIKHGLNPQNMEQNHKTWIKSINHGSESQKEKIPLGTPLREKDIIYNTRFNNNNYYILSGVIYNALEISYIALDRLRKKAQERLLTEGVSQKDAVLLVSKKNPFTILKYYAHLPFWLSHFQKKNPEGAHSPGGILLRSIQGQWGEPPEYRRRIATIAKQKKQAETEKYIERQEVLRTRKNLDIYEIMSESEQRDFWQWMRDNIKTCRKYLGDYRPFTRADNLTKGFIVNHIDEFIRGRHPP